MSLSVNSTLVLMFLLFYMHIPTLNKVLSYLILSYQRNRHRALKMVAYSRGKLGYNGTFNLGQNYFQITSQENVTVFNVHPKPVRLPVILC